MKVLVTDGNCRSALAATRSLGLRGIKVIVSEEFDNNLSASSRYCYKSYVYASPYFNWQGFLSNLLGIIKEESPDLILPMTDISMMLVLSAQSSFDKKVLAALPSIYAYNSLSDKINLVRLATELDIPCPRSFFIFSKDDLDNVCRLIEFPVILKPARSRLYSNGMYVSTYVRYANTETELRRMYGSVTVLKHPFLIQEIVSGFGAGIFALYNRGCPVTFFSHKRLRERPPSGGVSVLCESVPIDTRLKTLAERLLNEVGWHGVAMVEFKVDPKSNIPYLMEVNGRFWGSLQLAIECGVDFPYMLYRIGMNDAHVKITEYEIGRKSRWLLGDMDHLYFRLSKTAGNEGFSTDSYGRIKALYECLNYNGNRCTFDVLKWWDIRPFIVELIQYLIPHAK